MMGRYLLVRL
jgi:hypothetical protein